MKLKLTVSSYWHIAIEFGRRIKGLVIRQIEIDAAGRNEGVGDFDYDPVTGEVLERQRIDYVWNLQTTHGSIVAQNHYTLTLQFPSQLQPEMILNYQEINRLWHRFLAGKASDFTIKHPAGYDIKKTRYKIIYPTKWLRHQPVLNRDTIAKTNLITSNIIVQDVDIDAGLRKLFGWGAKWKSAEQRACMAQIMAMQSDGV
jgi:hypothetical protein